MRKKSVISLLTLVTSLTLTACSFQFSTPKDFPQVPDQVQEISVELGKEISDIVDSTDFTDADQLDQMTTEVVEWAKDYAETEESISEFQKATLMRVVDGDTIVVEIDGEEYKVRLIGINTPESVASEEYLEKTGKENSQAGKDASAFTKEILKNTTTVYLEKDISETDKYGRLLRYVWLEIPTNTDDLEEISTKMLNAILVKEGVANIATYEPDTAHEDDFLQLDEN